MPIKQLPDTYGQESSKSNKTSFTDFDKAKKSLEQTWLSWSQQPTDEMADDLLRKLEPTISSGLTSFAGADKSLRPRALILTMEALQRYDPNSGASLKTHVYNNLKSLHRYKAERSSVVHIPENARLDSDHIYKFKQTFMDREGREPNFDEISDGTGFSLKRIQKANMFGKELSTSQMTDEKGDLASEDKTDPQTVWRDYVYHDLDDINKKIMEWTSGYNGSEVLAKKDIAMRLKISPAAVSQRIGTIVKRLEEGGT